MCCPICHGGLRELTRSADSAGRIKEGQLLCESCHQVVAEVHEFKYDFHVGSDAPLPTDGAPVSVVPADAERRIPGDSTELSWTQNWQPCAPHYLFSGGSSGDTCSFTGVFTDALVRLIHHPNGGIVDVVVDDKITTSIDLFQAQGSFTEPVIAATDLAATKHTIEIITRGTANPASGGQSCLIEEVVLYGPAGLEGFAAPAPLNYGNPYSTFIEGYTEQAGTEDLILELGGGDRRYGLPNRVNFEYLKFELADIYGDVHSLPFADNSFSMVTSQAVFEHLANPQAAAQELIRVTRPGGLIITEVAFLQPLHAVPFHFFNMTLWGVQELFKSCQLLESDWFGPLSGTVMWLLDAAKVTDKIPADQLARIQSEFESFDTLMSHEDLEPVASGVHIAVRKPL
jgi:SAM-dependent methyltransferase